MKYAYRAICTVGRAHLQENEVFLCPLEKSTWICPVVLCSITTMKENRLQDTIKYKFCAKKRKRRIWPCIDDE